MKNQETDTRCIIISKMLHLIERIGTQTHIYITNGFLATGQLKKIIKENKNAIIVPDNHHHFDFHNFYKQAMNTKGGFSFVVPWALRCGWTGLSKDAMELESQLSKKIKFYCVPGLDTNFIEKKK